MRIILFLLSFIPFILPFIFLIIAFNLYKRKLINKILLNIGIVLAIAFASIFIIIIFKDINSSKNKIKIRHCATAYGCKSNGDGTMSCYYDDENGNKTEITCNGG